MEVEHHGEVGIALLSLMCIVHSVALRSIFVNISLTPLAVFSLLYPPYLPDTHFAIGPAPLMLYI